MPIPTLSGFIAGEKASAAKLTLHTKTAIEEAVYFKPYCRINNSATQTFVSSSSVSGADCVMNTILDDTDGMADLVNNHILITTPGLYRLNAQVAWATNATGFRVGLIFVNSNARSGGNTAAVTGAPTRFVMTAEERLNAGDFVFLRMGQNSGSSLLTDIGYRGCWLSAEWVSQ